jgi:hypothetical protein
MSSVHAALAQAGLLRLRGVRRRKKKGDPQMTQMKGDKEVSRGCAAGIPAGLSHPCSSAPSAENPSLATKSRRRRK